MAEELIYSIDSHKQFDSIIDEIDYSDVVLGYYNALYWNSNGDNMCKFQISCGEIDEFIYYLAKQTGCDTLVFQRESNGIIANTEILDVRAKKMHSYESFCTLSPIFISSTSVSPTSISHIFIPREKYPTIWFLEDGFLFINGDIREKVSVRLDQMILMDNISDYKNSWKIIYLMKQC